MDSEVNHNSAFYVRFNKGYELVEKYPNHIPVMFSLNKNINIDKNTCMLPRESPLSHMVLQFRKYLSSSDANSSPTMGFIFHIKCNNNDYLPKLTEKMGDLHQKYHSSDMWLVVKIDHEDIFGWNPFIGYQNL